MKNMLILSFRPISQRVFSKPSRLYCIKFKPKFPAVVCRFYPWWHVENQRQLHAVADKPSAKILRRTDLHQSRKEFWHQNFTMALSEHVAPCGSSTGNGMRPKRNVLQWERHVGFRLCPFTGFSHNPKRHGISDRVSWRTLFNSTCSFLLLQCDYQKIFNHLISAAYRTAPFQSMKL